MKKAEILRTSSLQRDWKRSIVRMATSGVSVASACASSTCKRTCWNGDSSSSVRGSGSINLSKEDEVSLALESVHGNVLGRC